MTKTFRATFPVHPVLNPIGAFNWLYCVKHDGEECWSLSCDAICRPLTPAEVHEALRTLFFYQAGPSIADTEVFYRQPDPI